MSSSNPRSAENPRNPTLPLPLQTKKLMIHPQNPRNRNISVGFQPFRTPIIPQMNQEACNQFRMGSCRYGGNCKYRHDVEQRLLSNEPRIEGMLEMGQWFEGQRVENRVVKPCKWSKEMCPYAQKCLFAHKFEPNTERILERSVDGVVPYGQAKRGCRISGQELDQMDYSRFREAVRKTKLCHKWEAFGSCPYGGACHYAHGREELRKTGSVSSPGLETNALEVNLLISTSGRAGSSSCVQKKHSKKTMFKWNDVEKISRIYADWVDLAPVY